MLSLVTGTVALAGALQMSGAAEMLGAVRLVLFAFGMTSVGVGMVTLIPTSVGGVLSDGARLLRAVRSGEAARRDAAAAALVGLALGTERPREWPVDLVAEAQDGAGGASVELLLYYYALDRGDVGGARQRLQKALCAGPSSGLAAAVYALEAAFFEAAVRGDRERGRVWLNRVGVGGDPVLRGVVEGLLAGGSGVKGEAIERLAGRYGVYAVHAEWVRRAGAARRVSAG